MQTLRIKLQSPEDPEAVRIAAKLLCAGGVCALPTETVYGLAGNALEPKAVEKIFKAKGRPSDNPLIVHIGEIEQLKPLIREAPPWTEELLQTFWPGPLTVVLPKSERIPGAVSGGMDTVAVRMPRHPTMRAVINACGFPLAAPSANRSGSPSPTSAEHVLADLDGRIPLVLDGGECEVGIESTVLKLSGPVPCILRPGMVTLEQLRSVLPQLQMDPSVYKHVDENLSPASPGMKYKHYAPNIPLVLVQETRRTFAEYVNSRAAEKPLALCYDEDIPALRIPYISLGARGDKRTQARRLYAALRSLDEMDAEIAIAREPDPKGMGAALANRLLRAAAFEVVVI